jgi:Fe-S cluster assembly protein SufD
MSETQADVGGFRAAYDALVQRDGAPGWLSARRSAAWERFERLGLPTTKDEAWRFTSVAPIARIVFEPAAANDVDAEVRALVSWLRFGAPCALVFINGRHSPQLSCPWPDDSVRLLTVAELLHSEPGRLQSHLGRLIGSSATPFVSLNDAMFEDGACVVIAAGRVVPLPISLVFVGTNRGAHATAAHPRVLVLAERACQATIVEAYGGVPGAGYLANGVSEIALEEGAVIDHVRVQRESEASFHIAGVAVRQARDSRYHALSLDLGAALSRTDIDVTLAGEGAECELDGLFLVDGERLSDTHTTIDHAQAHTTSREIYRGIVEGHSRGVFHGSIVVEPGAQKTDAIQHNKNLVLSPTALINSTPQLKILADDVRCKHASTTGQIDQQALFYLRSRGLSEEAARSLLTYAFAGDIVGRAKVDAVRQAIGALLRERLPAVPEEAAL